MRQKSPYALFVFATSIGGVGRYLLFVVLYIVGSLKLLLCNS